MALIVEDGTGLPNAEVYASVAEADAYLTSRGYNWSTMTEAEKEQALRRAADYLQQVYRLKWSGTRTTGTQALDWPRAFVLRDDYQYQGLNGTTFIGGNFYFPANEVPKEVVNANIELALKAASGDLAPDIGQRVLREKVDVLEVQYDQYSPQFTQYRAIDNLLAPFLSSRGNTSKALIRT
jgi:hypothetical protein